MNRSSIRRCIAFLAVVLTLLIVSKAHQRWLRHYHRSYDSELLSQIQVSDAAKRLPSKGSLLCWVQTAPQYHETRGRAINATWLPRCDHGVFFTSAPFREENVPFRTVFTGIPEYYENLFFKSRFALRYIQKHMVVDFDWVMKADDDTYVIVENLRKYLQTLDPSKPYYLGFRLKAGLGQLEQGYNSGGSGYVLSRAALEEFSKRAYFDEYGCPDDLYEDVGIGRCLASIGIFPHKTLNDKGQNRFFGFPWGQHFHGFGRETEWFFDPPIHGFNGFGDDAISFHSLLPDQLLQFDLFLYRIKLRT